MDWRIFIATFWAIFLAELGDKTQLVNLSMTAKTGSWVSVFAASVAAFGIVTLITISLGGVLNRFMRPEYIKYGAASLFVLIGLLMFFGKI